MRKGILILLCNLLLIVGGCASVKIVDKNGLPIPDHVVRGSVPSLGTQVDFAFIRYFGLKEGDEYLDTHEYLNPYEARHSIKQDHLRSLVMTVHILNPRKNTYQFLLYYDVPSTDVYGNVEKQHPAMQKKELLYKGNLSRKEFNISLPIEDGIKYQAWFEMRDEDDNIRFMGPVVHYEVVGRSVGPVSELPVTNSDGSKVAGVPLGDPLRMGR